MKGLKKRNDFLRLASVVKEVADYYFFALKHVESREKIFDSEEAIRNYEQFVLSVRSAYNKLDNVEKALINNDFFYEKYPFWWEKIYSKTTYYRLKRRSMTNFMEALNNEH